TIHEELATTVGPYAPLYPTVARWAKHFHEGKEDINDEPRSGRLIFEFTDANIELVRQVISNDPHSSYDDIITETSLSHGIIEQVNHHCLKMKKVRFRWVPHQLNDEQKRERFRLCRENLAKFRDGSWRLCDIITGDETSIYPGQIRHKSTNASWIGGDESLIPILRRSRFEPKTLFSIFFKSNGPVLINAVDKGNTIIGLNLKYDQTLTRLEAQKCCILNMFTLKSSKIAQRIKIQSLSQI
ncbi:unnamed protein product, partial [Rotaria sordida]